MGVLFQTHYIVAVIATTAATRKTNFFIFAQTRTYGFSEKKLRRERTDLSVHSAARLWRSFRSEARNPRQLEIFIAAVKLIKIDLENEELLVYSESSVDFWVENTLTWIIVVFVHG